MFTLNCKGKLISFEMPLVMGIINATKDSFYEGHFEKTADEIIALAGKMILDGADILDIGGQSTRPGSERIAAKDEASRVIPVIKNIRKKFPEIIISIDTYHSLVAKAAVDEGADMINDISGGEMDDEMLTTAASLKVPYICMHMKGRPETMHIDPHYDDVVKEVLDFFILKIHTCKNAGIKDMIIDPGFGFGKTINHNFILLKNLTAFKMLDKPILAGLSRKSTVYRSLGITAAEALNGTTVMHTLAIENGANILRVHDVKEAKEAVILMDAYKKAAP